MIMVVANLPMKLGGVFVSDVISAFALVLLVISSLPLLVLEVLSLFQFIPIYIALRLFCPMILSFSSNLLVLFLSSIYLPVLSLLVL